MTEDQIETEIVTEPLLTILVNPDQNHQKDTEKDQIPQEEDEVRRQILRMIEDEKIKVRDQEDPEEAGLEAPVGRGHQVRPRQDLRQILRDHEVEAVIEKKTRKDITIEGVQLQGTKKDDIRMNLEEISK